MTTERVGRESLLERWFVKECDQRLWRCYKLRGRAEPDRLVIADDGVCVFIEFKAKGKKPSRAQEREHIRLRSLGHRVDVISAKYKAEELLAELGRRGAPKHPRKGVRPPRMNPTIALELLRDSKLVSLDKHNTDKFMEEVNRGLEAMPVIRGSINSKRLRLIKEAAKDRRDQYNELKKLEQSIMDEAE